MFDQVDTYDPDWRVLRVLAELEPDTFDVIVIGNNMGAGVVKAEVLSEACRSKVVVVWLDTPNEAATLPYRELGYTHFARRKDLEEYLQEHFLSAAE